MENLNCSCKLTRVRPTKGVMSREVVLSVALNGQQFDASTPYVYYRHPVVEAVTLAVGETAILLHPLLPLVGVSISMERGCQQIDRNLADG